MAPRFSAARVIFAVALDLAGLAPADEGAGRHNGLAAPTTSNGPALPFVSATHVHLFDLRRPIVLNHPFIRAASDTPEAAANVSICEDLGGRLSVKPQRLKTLAANHCHIPERICS